MMLLLVIISEVLVVGVNGSLIRKYENGLKMQLHSPVTVYTPERAWPWSLLPSVQSSASTAAMILNRGSFAKKGDEDEFRVHKRRNRTKGGVFAVELRRSGDDIF